MQLKLLQLNINALNHLSQLQNFLQQHTFDILQFQEVVGKGTTMGNIYSSPDSMEILEKILGPSYQSFLAKNDTITSSPTAYFGSATFIHLRHPVVHHEIIWLHKRNTPFPQESHQYGHMTRSVLAVKIATDTTPLWLLNTHLTWGPTQEDTPEKMQQSKKLLEFVASLKEPFLLSGDFNVDNNSQIIRTLEKYGRNLPKEYQVTNTLNPRTHRARHLFPKGLAVDFIFTSPTLLVKDFQMLHDDISDHLGLAVTIEIE